MATVLTPYKSLLLEYEPRPIRNEREHRKALRQIESLMTPHPTRERGELIELLATLIEQYELAEYPTPKVSPREMLAHYLEARELTNAALSRATGIPRSVLTNVLNGRRAISKANAVKLSAFFRVPVGVFIERE